MASESTSVRSLALQTFYDVLQLQEVFSFQTTSAEERRKTFVTPMNGHLLIVMP